MRVAFALTIASAGCSSLLGIDDLRLGGDGPPGPPDGGGDASGATCIGGGLLQVCPDPPPISELAVVGPQTIDTGSDPACVTMRSGTVEVCAIVRGSIDIAAAATLRVIGPRPLVLASMSTISVLGAIDVASYLGKSTGAGANAKACLLIGPPGSGGGGAGGSFGGAGGTGGNGGTTSPPPVLTLTEIRGGCAGGLGGGNMQPAGAGGGAVYLMARDGIVVEGRINASGAGGSGTINNTSASGGAGGGAGGLIGLDAPAISGAGTLFANGGGAGGGGGTLLGEGKPGTESPDAKSPGLGGTSSFGADGGNGSVGTSLNGASGLDSPGGVGGGGGGGAGVIYVRGAFTVTGAISPPAKITPP